MVLAIRKAILKSESVRRTGKPVARIGITEIEVAMKVAVDAQRCQGHTLCAMAAPAFFELSEIDGHATAVDAEVPAVLEETAREASRSCPEQAITIL